MYHPASACTSVRVVLQLECRQVINSCDLITGSDVVKVMCNERIAIRFLLLLHYYRLYI